MQYAKQKSELKEVFLKKPLAGRALFFETAADPSTALGQCIALKQEGKSTEPTEDRGRCGAICHEARKSKKEVFMQFLLLDNRRFLGMSEFLSSVISLPEKTERGSLWNRESVFASKNNSRASAATGKLLPLHIPRIKVLLQCIIFYKHEFIYSIKNHCSVGACAPSPPDF